MRQEAMSGLVLLAATAIMASLLLVWPSRANGDDDSPTYTDCRLTEPLEVEPVWPVPTAAGDFDCEDTSDEAETWEA